MYLLKNRWYVASWSDDIGVALVAKRILDEPVVLFRDEAGVAHALRDACPHRFVPLSAGTVEGNNIKCRYHGLEFGTDGQCTGNPFGATNIVASVKIFPLVERHQILWIWPGSAPPEPDAIPDLSFIEDRSSKTVKGTIRMEANYRLVIDNLMDLTHAAQLHPNGIASPELIDSLQISYATMPDDAVEVDMWSDQISPPAFWRRLLPPGIERINFKTHMRWEPASNLVLRVAVEPLPGAERAAGWPDPAIAVHLLTPETQGATTYYWTSSRSVMLDDVEMDKFVYDMVTHAFVNEDEPILEMQQRYLGETDLMTMRPSLLPTDAAPTQVRRKLKQLIKRENG